MTSSMKIIRISYETMFASAPGDCIIRDSKDKKMPLDEYLAAFASAFFGERECQTDDDGINPRELSASSSFA